MDLAEHCTKTGRSRSPTPFATSSQTCEALAEAHAAKIVHRDLKPANLFLAKGPDRRKMIKVLDFGVSKIHRRADDRTGRMLGTVVYMSPEQLHAAHDVDLRTDIWSLGVILYELLTGAPPFKRANNRQRRPAEHLGRDVAADVLEVHVDPVGHRGLQVLGERRGPVVDRDVEPELVEERAALVGAAGDPDRPGALDLGDLADGRADRAAGRRHHDGLALRGSPISSRPAYAVKPGIPSTPSAVETGCDGRVELPQAEPSLSAWLCQPE